MQTEARSDRQTLVSVVVATYDDIDYTARCLKSLQEQTLAYASRERHKSISASTRASKRCRIRST